MDAFDFLTKLRNYPQIESEQLMPTRELLRRINIAYAKLTSDLWKLPEVQQSFTLTVSDNVAANPYRLPDRVGAVLNATLATYLCSLYAPEKKVLVAGSAVNYTPSTLMPACVNFGHYLEFYPAPSTYTAIVLQYMSKAVPLEFGIATAAVAASVNTLTLDYFASFHNDQYNDMFIGVYYDGAAVGRGLDYYSRYRVSDYVGLTRVATVASIDAKDLINAASFYYAFEPLLPDRFHDKIILLAEMGLMQDGILTADATKFNEYVNFLKAELA